MRAYFEKLRFLGLASLLALPTGCLSKGDTYVGSDKVNRNDDDEPTQEDSGSPDRTPSGRDEDDDTADDDVSDDDVTDDDMPVGDDDAADDDAVADDDDPPNEPDVPAPEPDAPAGQGGDSSGPSGAAGEENEPEPEEPAELGACEQGQLPGKGEPVQLTDVVGSKSGLQVSVGQDAFLVVWGAEGIASEVGYQGFDSALESTFDATTLPNSDGITSRPALAFAFDRDEHVVAYDHGTTVRVRSILADGSPAEMAALETDLVAIGSPLALSIESGTAFVSTMSSGGGCPGTGAFGGWMVDLDTGDAALADVGPCVNSSIATFAVPGSGFGWIADAGQATLQLLKLDGTRQGSGVVLYDIDITQGVVAVYDGTRVVLVVRDGSDVGYARFNPNGTQAGDAATIYATGTPVSAAVSEDAVGVAVQDGSTVHFFAQAAGSGASVHPPGEVAAVRDLAEPVLATLDGAFYLFFLAPDAYGDPQVFASPIQCEQEMESP